MGSHSPASAVFPAWSTPNGCTLSTPSGDSPFWYTTAIHAVAYVVAIWTWTFAVIGTALRFLSAYRAKVRYVADSSYWMYLVHVPIVMVLHVALSLMT